MAPFAYNSTASYELVLKINRINEDLRNHKAYLKQAINTVLDDRFDIPCRVIVRKEKYTILTRHAITRWQKICIGKEIAQIPYLRALRIIKRDINGEITSSRLFKFIKKSFL